MPDGQAGYWQVSASKLDGTIDEVTRHKDVSQMSDALDIPMGDRSKTHPCANGYPVFDIFI